MDRDGAEQLAQRLNRDHPERGTHTWLARESDGEWAVVKVPLPPGARRGPLGTAIEQPDGIDYWPYEHYTEGGP
jgi:hypothetical protein